MGVGIPFNTSFMSLEEISEIGSKLAEWDRKLQVTVLDYRPEFRAQSINRPTYEEMLQVKTILENSGLKKVICQTSGLSSINNVEIISGLYQ